MFAYNLVIMRTAGVQGVSAFTVVGYTSYVFSMILLGFGQGTSPLISFSHGAKELQLTRKIRRLTNRIVLLCGVCVTVLLWICARQYSNVFLSNQDVIRMTIHGIHIFSFSFLFCGINSITSFYFTSIGKAKESAVISTLRGLLLLMSCIIFLPKLFGMTGVWLAAPVTEAITLVVALSYLMKDKREALTTEVKSCEC